MRKHLSAAAIAALVGFGTLPGASPLTVSADAAQANKTPEEERRRNRLQLSQRVGRDLNEILNDINEDPPRYSQALSQLNSLLQRDLSKYDESTIREIRASVYVGLDNLPAALNDFVRIIEIDELPFDRLKQIRNNVAQLYFATENYSQAVRFMEQFIAEEGASNIQDDNVWFILAAAYSQLDRYQEARRPAERAKQYDTKNQKKNFDLLNLIYSELGQRQPRLALLEEAIQYFPNEKGYWIQLTGLYGELDRPKDALATLEAAYNAGLVSDEPTIRTLAEYYSALQNPFRGAKLLEEEMAAGTVKRDLRNLRLLAQLWSMARDQDKAIEALTAAARISPTGELYYRIGQSYFADENFNQAIRNLNEALNRGGLSAKDRGDIYLLLGNAYFELDPDTVAGRNRARRSYQQAARISSSASEARRWIAYITAFEDTLRRQDEVERIQRQERRERELERCLDVIDLFEIGGVADESQVADCQALIAEVDVDGNGGVDDAEARAYATNTALPEPTEEDETSDGEETDEEATESDESE